MKKLDVLFVGIGSIAKKHIKNLRCVCEERGIDLIIDAFRSGKGEYRSDDLVEISSTITDISQIKKVYDIIFITNPTNKHIDSLNMFKFLGKSFFVEKPISDIKQISKVKGYNKNDNALYYIACPLRYAPVLQYLKNNMNKFDIVSVRCISSSYLPEWRKGVDYRKNYSAHKNQGGGVDIDLIHEWDYITYLFGFPIKVLTLMGKKSNLEIDSNDYALYIGEYEDKVVELHLDYFGRKRIREIMLFTTQDTIIGDIENNRIKFLKSGKILELDKEKNIYKDELNHFLDIIKGKSRQDNNIEQAIKILKLTQGEV